MRLLARYAAPKLTGPTDIVGYPTFANFNFELWFWNYRLTVFAFPVFAIIGYALLTRFGPLQSRIPWSARRNIELVEPVPTASVTPEGVPWGTLARILLPAAVVVAACGARTGRIDLLAVATGVFYVAIAVVAAEMVTRRTHGQRWRALSTVNGVGGAVAAVLSLWFVSAHTVVQTASGTRSWPWLVWWLPVLGVVAIGWWSARQLRGGRDGARCRADAADGCRGCDRAVPGDVGSPRTGHTFPRLRRRPRDGRRERGRPWLFPLARPAFRPRPVP